MEAVIGGAEGYTERMAKFEGTEGINDSEGLPIPQRIRLLLQRAI